MTIIDLFGKTVTVTDLKEAIKEAEMYVEFSKNNNDKHLKFLYHTLTELNKLVEPEPIKIETVVNGKVLPFHVLETRKIFGATKDYKGYIKNDKHQPLYGLHSCAKSPRILNRIIDLEVGESTTNSNWTKITRVY